MTNGIYDYDFFNYSHVIPNLECAKLIEYFRQHNEIAVLTQNFQPQKYSHFYFRKDYDDGNFQRQIFDEKCIYGGRAFSGSKYAPMSKEKEYIVADMSIYKPYINYFSKIKKEQEHFKRILNCMHLRLSIDSENLVSLSFLSRHIKRFTSGIFLHDYDMQIPGAVDLLLQLQNYKGGLNVNGLRPFAFGNKFPIHIYNEDQLRDWFRLIMIPDGAFFQYEGIMEPRTVNYIVNENQRTTKNLLYNISISGFNENEYLSIYLPKIFLQVLFLRRNKIKILLTYDQEFFKIKPLRDLISLWNFFLKINTGGTTDEGYGTLYNFCRNLGNGNVPPHLEKIMPLTLQEMRDSFTYIMEKNPTLFDWFYQLELISYNGGNFKDDRTGNSFAN